MTEDAEEFTPLWWKLRYYNDDKFEDKLIEAIQAKDKPSTGIVYRIFLFVCGILLFFVGWVMWNLALPAEGESGAVGMNLKTFFFFIGILVQLALGPYFAVKSISDSGRLSPMVPKARVEYFRLKATILDREVHDHYWTALRDPDHEHHNEIIRYKWMDKVRWKHYPSDFFGYQIFTKGSGEEVRGPLVPKSSDAYRNSNVTYDEEGKPLFEGATHPLKRILTLPMFLFIFGLVSFPISVINAIFSYNDNYGELLSQISTSFLMLIILGLYLIRRNTHLMNADANADASLDDLEERLRLLCERYVAIP